MAEAVPKIEVDPPPRAENQQITQSDAEILHTQTYSEPRAHHPQHYRQRSNKPAGPQLWAVVLTLGGLYYLWTRILGKKLPSFASVQRGHRIGKTGGGRSGIGSGSINRQAEIQAARERQQQRLQNAARAREMVKQATNNGNIRERTNINNTSSGNNALSIQQQQRL